MRKVVAAALFAATLAACGGTAKTGSEPSKDTGAGAVDATVQMKEYAYVVSGTMKAGGTLRLSNIGTQFHMMGLGKIKDGKTLADVKAALMSDDEADDAATVEEISMPGSFMGPGNTADVSVSTLTAGTYAMVCFVNVEGEETPHMARGMIGELTVSADPGKAATPDASYQVSKGKAITGPAALKAGRHTFEVSRDDTAKGQEPTLVKLNPGATVEQFGAAAKLFDEGPLPVGAASKLPGTIVIGLHDFNDTQAVTLTVELTPGTYVLAADDSDVENKPDAPVERILITVT